MADDPDRHMRVRLARQRTAPRRVQPLTRDDESAPQPQPSRTEPAPATHPAPPPAPRVGPWLRAWGGRITLGRLGAATAVASLLFTGTATYYQAEVASRQLADAREQSAQARREQAIRVTYWSDYPEMSLNPGPAKVHVMNRSPDVVTGVELLLAVNPHENARGSLVAESYVHTSTTAIPPCTELTYTMEGLDIRTFAPALPIHLPPHAVLQPDSLYFADSNGLLWHRDATHLKEVEHGRDVMNVGGAPVASSRVAECGDTAL